MSCLPVQQTPWHHELRFEVSARPSVFYSTVCHGWRGREWYLSSIAEITFFLVFDLPSLCIAGCTSSLRGPRTGAGSEIVVGLVAAAIAVDYPGAHFGRKAAEKEERGVKGQERVQVALARVEGRAVGGLGWRVRRRRRGIKTVVADRRHRSSHRSQIGGNWGFRGREEGTIEGIREDNGGC